MLNIVKGNAALLWSSGKVLLFLCEKENVYYVFSEYKMEIVYVRYIQME